jgi:hypothetical protein
MIGENGVRTGENGGESAPPIPPSTFSPTAPERTDRKEQERPPSGGRTSPLPAPWFLTLGGGSVLASKECN